MGARILIAVAVGLGALSASGCELKPLRLQLDGALADVALGDLAARDARPADVALSTEDGRSGDAAGRDRPSSRTGTEQLPFWTATGEPRWDFCAASPDGPDHPVEGQPCTAVGQTGYAFLDSPLYISTWKTFLCRGSAFVCQRAWACNGRRATMVGTAASETLQGTAGSDVIVGLGGNDTIFGGGGDDTICGTDGDDALNGEEGDDVLMGGGGDDRLYGKEGIDLCDGGSNTAVGDWASITCETVLDVP